MTDTYGWTGRLWQLYVNNSSRYVRCEDGMIWVPKEKAKTNDPEEKRPPLHLNMAMLCGHVNGRFNVAVFASQKSAKFICFDIDYSDIEILKAVVDTLVDLGFDRRDIHPSVSGGKGFHVEIFFDKPMANAALKRLYEGVIAAGGFDRHKVEFRPTPNQAVRLPLSRHYKTGVVGWYLDPETLQPIESQDYIYEIQQVSREFASALIGRIKLPKPEKPTIFHMKDVSADTDGMPVVTGHGQRHQLMTNIAVWRRGCGDDGETIYQKLMAWVAVQNRSLMSSTDEEIEEDARNIADWAGGLTIRKRDAGRPYGRDVFDAEDLNYILNGETKTERRILFRMVLARKVFKKDHVKQALIAEALGVHTVTVSKAIQALGTRGLITSIPGKRAKKTIGGHFCRTANTYYPGTNVAQVLDPADVAAPYWSMNEVLAWKKLLWYYASMMTAMLGNKLAKYVKKSEADEIAKIMAAGEPMIEGVNIDVGDSNDGGRADDVASLLDAG